jgi:hypothetical protein
VLVAVICFAGEASPLPMMRISSHTADAGRGPPPSVRERGGHAREKHNVSVGGSAARSAQFITPDTRVREYNIRGIVHNTASQTIIFTHKKSGDTCW